MFAHVFAPRAASRADVLSAEPTPLFSSAGEEGWHHAVSVPLRLDAQAEPPRLHLAYVTAAAACAAAFVRCGACGGCFRDWATTGGDGGGCKLRPWLCGVLAMQPGRGGGGEGRPRRATRSAMCRWAETQTALACVADSRRFEAACRLCCRKRSPDAVRMHAKLPPRSTPLHPFARPPRVCGARGFFCLRTRALQCSSSRSSGGGRGSYSCRLTADWYKTGCTVRLMSATSSPARRAPLPLQIAEPSNGGSGALGVEKRCA
jgi:hypothetical protein